MNMHASFEPKRHEKREFYWTPPAEIDHSDDVAPVLKQAVRERGNQSEFRFFDGEAFEVDLCDDGGCDIGSNGVFEVGVDAKGQACGIIRLWTSVIGPAWAQARPGDVENAFEQVYQALQDQGHL